MEVFLILVAVVGFIVAQVMDRTRIQNHIGARGGTIVSIKWAPFGTGWFGERNARIYEVVYYDHAGRQHFATCKTSLWAGVYWHDDQISHPKASWFDKARAIT